MDDTLATLFSRSPACLKEFETIELPRSPQKWNSGVDFTTRELQCRCGCKHYAVFGQVTVEVAGFFRKREKMSVSSPIFLECRDCNQRALLFDEETHGWNGQDPNATPSPIDERALNCYQESANVAVNYSYQSIENYQDLIDDGIANPEDYFDTFTIYLKMAESDYKLLETYKCA